MDKAQKDQSSARKMGSKGEIGLCGQNELPLILKFWSVSP